MTPHCNTCLHWNEDELDEAGVAPCELSENCFLSGYGDGKSARVQLLRLRTAGDEYCAHHEEKTVVKTPTTIVQRGS